MRSIVIGVGGLYASNKPGDIIKTYALGSCVAMILTDLKTSAMGMVHIAHPNSEVNPQKSKITPGYFADSAVPALMRLMAGLGCQMDGRGIVVKLVGGANVLGDKDAFEIGKRNILTIKI